MLSTRKIPIDLFHEIQQYCQPIDYYCFIICQKEYFQEIKKRTCKIYLKKEEIERYRTNQDDFRSQILSRVSQPSQQICFVLDQQLELNLMDLIATEFAELIVSENVQSMLQLQRLLHQLPERSHQNQIIRLRNSCITCSDISDRATLSSYLVYPPKDIISTSAMSYLRAVHIFEANLDILPPMNQLIELEVSFCPNFYDCSNLGYISDLSIKNCPKLINVAALNHNRKLLIFDCENIDVSMCEFQNVVFLSTDFYLSPDFPYSHVQRYFYRQKNAKPWIGPIIPSNTRECTFFSRWIYSARDSKCNVLTCDFLSSFRRLYHLTLIGITNFDLSLLDTIPSLQLEESFITTLSMIGNKKKYVHLKNCHKLVDFSPLSNIHKVTITSCEQFKDIDQVKNVYALSIHACPFFTHLFNQKEKNKSHSIHSLTIGICSDLGSHLNGWETIPVVYLLTGSIKLNESCRLLENKYEQLLSSQETESQLFQNQKLILSKFAFSEYFYENCSFLQKFYDLDRSLSRDGNFRLTRKNIPFK